METAISKWLSKRRGQLHIINEILKVASQGATKTRMMYNAKLGFKGINQYLNLIMENKLLLKTHEDYNPVYYASEKGLTFISSYTQLLQLFQ
jgi:predicted transcriptional regulator